MSLENNSNPQAQTLFKEFEHFCKCMLDAYVVVDNAGRPVKSNALFSQMVGLSSKQILKKSSIEDIITFKIGDKPVGSNTFCEHRSPTRFDEVAGFINGRETLNLIVGVYPLVVSDTTAGAFLLLRDVTAETALQDKYKDKATQSITDSLTGLFNRSYFVDYMASQISILMQFPAEAAQRALAIMMLDIDHFKKINDVYGHPAGDSVLQDLASLMKKTFRSTDVICRYGGEEFLVIFPSTSVEEAAIAAEKLRGIVETFEFAFDGVTIPLTISAGVAQVNIGFEDGDQTIARADAALYESKHRSRNTVSLHNGTKIKPYFPLKQPS